MTGYKVMTSVSYIPTCSVPTHLYNRPLSGTQCMDARRDCVRHLSAGHDAHSSPM